jgi:SAM-dependent methyltransferase
MANTHHVDKALFSDEHYLGKPAGEDDRIVGRRIRITERYSQFFAKDLTCVEVGCGSGVTIAQVGNRFRKSLGIDIYDYAKDFEIQKKKYGALNCSFKQLDLEQTMPEEQFDRLISFEVIEHLKNEASLAKYLNILKDGGMAAITVPNKWWIFETHGARLPLLPWNRVPFFSWLPSFIHNRYANARIYTLKGIRKLMEQHGFTVLGHCYITAPMDVLKEGWLKKRLLKYIFRNDITGSPFLSTSIFLMVQKKT